MARAEVNGTELFYELDGHGPPCLVLHGGLGLDHLLYRRTLTPLVERLRLVYLDHRGNGRSGRPPLETITMAQLADDAVAVADQLGLDRFLVLGHSYGGFIAQELAIRHPDRVAGLLLISTTPGQLGDGEDPDAYAGPPPPPELGQMFAALPTSDAELAEHLERLLPFYLHRRDPSEVAPLLEGTVYDLAAMVRGFQVLAQWSSVDRLGSISCPALLVAGREDLFTSHPQALRIADRLTGADADVVVLDDVGHFPWLEDPDGFFGAITSWLERKALS